MNKHLIYIKNFEQVGGECSCLATGYTREDAEIKASLLIAHLNSTGPQLVIGHKIISDSFECKYCYL